VSDLLSVLRIGEGAALTLKGGIRAVVRSLGSGANFKISWTTEKTPQMSREVSGVSGSKTSDVARHEVEPDVGHNGGLGLVENTVTASDDDMGRSSDGAPILVVDDNPMFCRVLRKLLVRDGLAPYFAANGIEAVDKLAAGVSVLPRVIICDLHMPIMNGREFLSHIKGDKRFNEIPVLVLTSDDDADAELQLLQFGADAFVSKTKDPRVLTSHIQRLLRQARIREAA
jgi:CheY-like chemotaxis protein